MNSFFRITVSVLLIFIASNSLSARERIVIKCGKFLDVKLGKLLSGKALIIEDERIVDIVSHSEIPSDAGLIDLSNATVLPGLIDAHVHLLIQGDSTHVAYNDQILKLSTPFRTIQAVAAARMALMRGLTTMRDIGNEGTGYADVDLKEAIVQGIIPGPRLQVAGRAMSITGAYPVLHYNWERSWPKGVQIVDGVENCRQAVREQIGNGADWIKVYCDRSYYIDTDCGISSKPNFTLDELKAIVDEAHRQHVKVAAHAIGRDGLRNALDAGVNSIEHGDGLDEALIDQAIKQGVYWSPTALVSKYVSGPRTKAGDPFWSAMLKNLHKAMKTASDKGMKIVLGTDAGGYPWTMNNFEELEIMVEHGISPKKALQYATLTPAELMDWQDDIGTLEKGKFADVVAVQGNPLDDISVLKNIRFVMKGGKVYRNDF